MRLRSMRRRHIRLLTRGDRLPTAAVICAATCERRQSRGRMFDNHFDAKRVLVTGVSGVKGTWLALMLLHAGAVVTGVDRRLAALRSNYTASGLGGRITFVHVAE